MGCYRPLIRFSSRREMKPVWERVRDRSNTGPHGMFFRINMCSSLWLMSFFAAVLPQDVSFLRLAEANPSVNHWLVKVRRGSHNIQAQAPHIKSLCSSSLSIRQTSHEHGIHKSLFAAAVGQFVDFPAKCRHIL